LDGGGGGGGHLLRSCPKLAFLARLSFFAAAQNWGLLLFDEARLLHDPAWEGAYSLKLMADVVCHEVAHQW
jgi:hypothetical protein